VLIAVGKRLNTVRVTNIDIWSGKDQSGNAGAVTLRNASLESVADRVSQRAPARMMRAIAFRDRPLAVGNDDPFAAFRNGSYLDVFVHGSLVLHGILCAGGMSD
jgi:hypothetical protein